MIRSPKRKPYSKKASSSSIVKESLPDGDRSVHTKLGKEGEKRVYEILCLIYGRDKVKVGDGTNGKPDLYVLDPHVLVEVKSCELIKKDGSLGGAKTFVHSWMRLTRHADARLMNRILLIEFRHKEQYLYIWISGEAMDKHVKEHLENDVVHLNFLKALKLGNLLEPIPFTLNPLRLPQTKLDEVMSAV